MNGAETFQAVTTCDDTRPAGQSSWASVGPMKPGQLRKSSRASSIANPYQDRICFFSMAELAMESAK